MLYNECLMFTGIIEGVADILDRSDTSLTVQRPIEFDDVKVGSSIAISGVCLSVTKLEEISMSFDVMPLTLEKTTLGSLKKNDRVNLERAMKADGRFEGHIVQGHIDAVGEVISLTKKGKDIRMTVEVPQELMKSIVLRGSIALDGVALTVAEIQDHSVTVGLIPITLKMTTLGERKEGDGVNVETDILARYLVAHSS